MPDPYGAIARFYDLVGQHDGADTDLYSAWARRLDAPVLELGVGTGRIAVPLASLGLEVYGVDASPAMLAIARARAAAAGVCPRLEQADWCDYRFDARFGLIFCAADSFLHLTEPQRQLAALRRAGEHLTSGGRLVLDLPALAGGWSDWEPGVRPLELLWCGPGPDGGSLQHFVSFTADAATQQRHVTHIFDEFRPGGPVHRTTASFVLRFISPGELELLVSAAGLRLVERYGGYDLEPFVAGCDRMIAVIARADGGAEEGEPRCE